MMINECEVQEKELLFSREFGQKAKHRIQGGFFFFFFFLKDSREGKLRF